MALRTTEVDLPELGGKHILREPSVAATSRLKPLWKQAAEGKDVEMELSAEVLRSCLRTPDGKAPRFATYEAALAVLEDVSQGTLTTLLEALPRVLGDSEEPPSGNSETSQS